MWDRSALNECAGTIASAVSTSIGIVMSFGVRRGSDQPGQEQGARLERQIALSPMTARHLRNMLGRLVADAASTKPPG
jgi:hypothetical protein